MLILVACTTSCCWVVVFFFFTLRCLRKMQSRLTYRRSCNNKGKKKTWLVCFQSAIKQTKIINFPVEAHFQISEIGIKQAVLESLFPWKVGFHRDKSFPCYTRPNRKALYFSRTYCTWGKKAEICLSFLKPGQQWLPGLAIPFNIFKWH